MDEIANHLDSVIQKAHAILKDHTSLKDEVGRLAEENVELKKKEDQDNLRIKELQNALNILKLSKKMKGDEGEKVLANDTSNLEMEKKIDQYIKEIDKCIALLSG